MSDETSIIQNESAFQYCDTTLKLKKTIETSFLSLGERLSKIRIERLWESNWSSWVEYLADMKITESTASRLITVYDTYVVKYALPEEKLASIGWSSLYEMARFIPSKQSAEDFVDKTFLMRKEDVRDEIRVARHGDHEHEWKEIHLRMCTVCGKKERLYAEDEE